jgi:predicted RNA binding protein YcfA (HicA-like mRNA interferase family)
MNGYYQLVIAVLQTHGFSLLRNGKGSHEIWGKAGCSAFPVSKNCASRHTANAIMKQAQIQHKF